MANLLSSTLSRITRESASLQKVTEAESIEGIPARLLPVYERFRENGVTPPPTFRGVDRDALAERYEQRSKLVKSLSSRSGQKREVLEKAREEEILRCRNDTIYWINNWGWTSDPRWLPGPTTLPMVLFDRQAEYVLWLEERYRGRTGGFIDKCRDMGLTWVDCYILIHKFTFEPGFKGAVGSRKEMLVDRLGDMDCIFEKMRFIARHLPLWMAPYLALPRSIETSMKMINPISSSSITGEAGDNIGRGGRNSLYLVDEAAFLERPQRVEAALSENCPSVFWISTTNIYAPGNVFDTKVSSGVHDVFTFDWWQDPRKDEAWLAERKKTLDPVVFATEIMRDRNSGLSNAVILREWAEAAIDFPIAGGIRRAGLDIADGGSDKTVLVIGSWPRVEIVEQVDILRPDPVKTAIVVAERCYRENVAELRGDATGVGSGCFGKWREMSLKFKVYKFHAGGKTSLDSDGKPEIVESFGRPSNLCYANAKAEAWWDMRQRFYKTWLMRAGEHYFPDDELISIPRDSELINQLCVPTWGQDLTGRIKIESKAELAARNVKSPDYAEALVIFLWTKNQEEDGDWISGFS